MTEDNDPREFDLGFDDLGEPEFPTPLNRIDERLDPVRELYHRLNGKIDPVREIYHASDRVLEEWYDRRHLLWRFAIAGGVSEALFQAFTFLVVFTGSFVGPDGNPSIIEIPSYIPLAIGAVALLAFFQWLQIKRALGTWSDQSEPEVGIRWVGAFSGAVIGGSFGFFVGLQGVVLGAATGAVLAEEVERRIDVRISRAVKNRTEIEQTVASEIEQYVDDTSMSLNTRKRK